MRHWHKLLDGIQLLAGLFQRAQANFTYISGILVRMAKRPGSAGSWLQLLNMASPIRWPQSNQVSYLATGVPREDVLRVLDRRYKASSIQECYFHCIYWSSKSLKARPKSREIKLVSISQWENRKTSAAIFNSPQLTIQVFLPSFAQPNKWSWMCRHIYIAI